MNNSEIRVKVNGGYLVARRNPDSDYNGIYIEFETDNGDIVDVVVAECPAQDDYKKINVYTYEDEWTEDWTRKYTLDIQEINKAFEKW